MSAGVALCPLGLYPALTPHPGQGYSQDGGVGGYFWMLEWVWNSVSFDYISSYLSLLSSSLSRSSSLPSLPPSLSPLSVSDVSELDVMVSPSGTSVPTPPHLSLSSVCVDKALAK